MDGRRVLALPASATGTGTGLRTASLALVVVAGLANIWSAVLLVIGLLKGTEGQDAGPLLGLGAAVWLTIIVVRVVGTVQL